MPGHAGTGGRDVIFAWEQCKLGDVAKINSGKDYKGLQPGKIPVYGTGGYMLSVNDKLSDIDAIGIGRKGTIDKPYYLNAPFWTVDTLFYVTPRGTVDISFMFPLFKNINWKRYDESTGVPSLSKNTIKKIRVSFPQNNEQVKIGDLFQKITQIITLHEEKKRQLECLKSALLQKMFADENGYPAVRFRGFDEAWKQCKLGDVGQTYTGLSGKSKEDFGHGKARFVTYMNIYSNPVSDLNMVEPIEIDERQNEVQYGDAFFTTSSETPEEVGMASVWTGDEKHTYLNSFCFGYRPISKINPYYLAYMLNSQSLRRKIVILAQGISRYNISKKSVMEIPASLPSAEEQNRIGLIFKDLDQSITLYEHKLELLKRLKSSLLQNMFI
ncbi:restriction endonuclease subunit S [Lactobacillus delbrueckii subsp. bulgaricus]|nr:restriction endonuclease subunit S [Lactobacillus delbrueckii subsp. bulgaricus]